MIVLLGGGERLAPFLRDRGIPAAYFEKESDVPTSARAVLWVVYPSKVSGAPELVFRLREAGETVAVVMQSGDDVTKLCAMRANYSFFDENERLAKWIPKLLSEDLGMDPEKISAGSVVLDRRLGTVYFLGHSLVLTAGERHILSVIALAHPLPVRADAIGAYFGKTEASVIAQIAQMNRKSKERTRAPIIVSKRGEGYLLNL